MIGNPLPELSILIIIVNNQQFVPHKLVSLLYPRYHGMYNMQKTLHKCSGYKQLRMGGRTFFLVSSLDNRSSGDIHQKYLHITVNNLLANDDDPLMILPYIFKTWARHDRLLPILCCRKI